MKGSEKQIKWASDIKKNIDSQISPLMGKAPHFVKMLSFISSIDNANFWIDIRSLMSALISHGLRIKGLDFSDIAKSDKQGNISFSNI